MNRSPYHYKYQNLLQSVVRSSLGASETQKLIGIKVGVAASTVNAVFNNGSVSYEAFCAVMHEIGFAKDAPSFWALRETFINAQKAKQDPDAEQALEQFQDDNEDKEPEQMIRSYCDLSGCTPSQSALIADMLLSQYPDQLSSILVGRGILMAHGSEKREALHALNAVSLLRDTDDEDLMYRGLATRGQLNAECGNLRAAIEDLSMIAQSIEKVPEDTRPRVGCYTNGFMLENYALAHMSDEKFANKTFDELKQIYNRMLEFSSHPSLENVPWWNLRFMSAWAYFLHENGNKEEAQSLLKENKSSLRKLSLHWLKERNAENPQADGVCERIDTAISFNRLVYSFCSKKDSLVRSYALDAKRRLSKSDRHSVIWELACRRVSGGADSSSPLISSRVMAFLISACVFLTPFIAFADEGC